ncbi:hypothetical protein [Prochlorococcus sp. MIT 1303]|uniref:hypothetical protein n=1 Tax=Prochlorococcus sp. MIT 1303 TaxID=1723647 RepID=UPI0007B3BF73|nr:hypothetical protein [Prochlorococcus sp. MIT 1303]KZR63493.1 hypothetical protein PMIT1303_01863 [Prochlorococcus sp. MIT 1303]
MSICPNCGGSGIQRISHLRFRTCLDCLGQGSVIEELNTRSVVQSPGGDLQAEQTIKTPIAAPLAS